MFKIAGLEDIEAKVHRTLRRNVGAWEEAGAGKFVLNVIKEGFKLNIKELPGKYEEKNNKSFFKEEEFAQEAIEKLVKMKVLKEVSWEEVDCINPLTMAISMSSPRPVSSSLRVLCSSYMWSSRVISCTLLT